MLEYEGENGHIPSVKAYFLKSIDYIFQKNFSIEFFELIQSNQRRISVMSRCRIPEFCERYKIDNGIYDPKSRRFLPRSVMQRDICLHINKCQYCVVWKKNRQDSLFNGAKGMDRNFKYDKNIINEKKI